MFKKIIKAIVGYLSKLTVEQEDVVGVDITPNCIRVAQLSSMKKKWTLTKVAYKYIDGGSNHSIVENPDTETAAVIRITERSACLVFSGAELQHFSRPAGMAPPEASIERNTET